MTINKTKEELITEVEALRQEVIALKQLVLSPFSSAMDEVITSQQLLRTSLNSVSKEEYTILVIEDSEDSGALRKP
ncbi:hypothetical protein LC613_33720 [Nostoc sphaeroides CHAB 2801]|uniref:hypothetical protein n=1 Tax=Nostoc sphaeroides TaxID=446679 RepID=UPI001E34D962|nr:hypothetical protein [Nostoc sphaeroides]MCC5632572.1 hypothetical protein [Nostoc sphaeroides CHAB 2801]